jgi:hypothetical protein
VRLPTEEQISYAAAEVPAPSAIGLAIHFLRDRWTLILILSGLVLIPCYWHRRIEAGDLGSHTYNAWLSVLVTQGRAPGLYLAHQWNNVIVDSLLAWFGAHIGFIAAERIVVSLCVVVFFWGAFAFISAASLRPPWFLTPAIAMVAYGYTFYVGFTNFYLSVGLAFFAAAVFWRGTRMDWIAGSILAVLTLMAHPIGFGLLVALVAYIRLAEFASGWHRWIVFALGLLTLVALHFFLHRFRTEAGFGPRFVLMNGADQLVLFGERYRLFAEYLLVFGSCAFLGAAIHDRKRLPLLQWFRTPLELWAIFVFAVAVLPGTIWFPQYAAAVSSINSRMTAVTAILGLSVLGAVQPRKWILAGLSVFAVIYFTLQYRDTAILNNMEQQVENLVSSLPVGTRVAYTIDFGNDSRINSRHMVDRACIEKCFTYSNYEPATEQFRLRVSPQGSPILSTSGLELEHGDYVVRPEDLPLVQIYQSDENDLSKLAKRSLSAGEKNGRIGHHPPPPESPQLHRH